MSDKKGDSGRFRDAFEEKVKSAEQADSPEQAPAKAAGSAPGASVSAPEGESILTKQFMFFGPRLADMAIFCRQLSMLLEVGISLVRSLRILAERSQHPGLKKVAGEVAQDVEEGRRLSEAFARHPKTFSALLINVARIGESGGILESSLTRLADTMERKLAIRKRIRAACMYPAVAITVAAMVLLAIFVYAIPVFARVYREELGIELPKITQIIINISDFAVDYWAWGVPLAVVGVILLNIFGRMPAGKQIYDWLRLKLPVLGGINKKINVARTSRNLGNLLTAGIPLLEALGILAETSENNLVGEAIGLARDNVERGGKMEQPLRESGIFPDMVIDMITIGDEAGALDTMLMKVAEIYDGDVDTDLQGLTSLIEPILIVLLGGVVMVVALAVFYPYLGLVQANL